MTSCKVHNVKFYKLDPLGINCMAYDKKGKKLALSRSDATIEIWNILHAPFLERTIPNRVNSSVEALCWYNRGHNTRLFSVGLLGQLVEYDLCNLCEKYSIPITGSAGWCMDIHKKSSQLVIGTEQGYLNLYRLKEDDVEYLKLLDKQEGRILCLKFDDSGNFIASGSIDTIRIWNVNSGHAIHKMNLSRINNATETVVWCLAITKDFTIISGDSRGCLTFWDGETGSQIESYSTHVSSILTICLSDDNKTVYCSGIDPIIATYEKVEMKGKGDKWVKSIQRNIHDNDVRSLIVAEDKLYSAGVDGYLACSYQPKILNKYPPLLQNSCVSLARKAKLILLRYRKKIEIWKLGVEVPEDNSEGILMLGEKPKKLLELQTKKDEATLCAAISNNGQFVVYSTASRLRLFQFNYENESAPELLPIINIPEECSSSVCAEFTPDSSHLILASRLGNIQIVNLKYDSVFISQIIDTTDYMKDTISFLNISTCGTYLVAADSNSNIIIWKNSNKTWTYFSSLPHYHSSPTAIGIHPTTLNLLVVYADQKIIEYNLLQKAFTEFSRQLNKNHPRQWLNRSCAVTNISFDPRSDHIVFLHDDSAICVINKEKKLPTVNTKIPKLESSSSVDSFSNPTEHSFHIIKKYKHLVYFGWLGDDEMVAVEINPLSFLEKLPPCLAKKKFGRK